LEARKAFLADDVIGICEEYTRKQKKIKSDILGACSATLQARYSN
jgi:hypothetical protein